MEHPCPLGHGADWDQIIQKAIEDALKNNKAQMQGTAVITTDCFIVVTIHASVSSVHNHFVARYVEIHRLREAAST